MEQWERELLGFVASVYQTMGWYGVTGLMMVESVFIPLPSEVVMPLAGWMLIKESGLGVMQVGVAGFYGAVGSALGAVIIYIIGRWGGRPFLERYGRYVLISRGDLERADKWFSRYGDRAVFVCRLVPGVRSVVSLPAGIAKMSIVKFLLFSFLGAFIWATALAYGGYLLGEHWSKIRLVISPFSLFFIIVLVGVFAIYVWRRLRKLSNVSEGDN